LLRINTSHQAPKPVVRPKYKVLISADTYGEPSIYSFCKCTAVYSPFKLEGVKNWELTETSDEQCRSRWEQEGVSRGAKQRELSQKLTLEEAAFSQKSTRVHS